MRRNPHVTIYNPPIRRIATVPRGTKGYRSCWNVVGTLSLDVRQLKYVHHDDGEAYRHEFEDDVWALLLEDDRGRRAVLLQHGKDEPLWGDF